MEFVGNKITNLENITINRNPFLDEEASNKKYVDDAINNITFLSFNQTLQNYLKVTVGHTEKNLTQNDRKQTMATTIIEAGNAGGHLLLLWRIDCNDKNNAR